MLVFKEKEGNGGRKPYLLASEPFRFAFYTLP